MKNGVFTLQGPHEGKTMVILEKYSFVDGVMKVSQNDAFLMKAILVGHYGCELTFEDAPNQGGDEQGATGEGSLSVAHTKPGGMTEGDKVTAQALNAKLATAASVEPKDEK